MQTAVNIQMVSFDIYVESLRRPRSYWLIRKYNMEVNNIITAREIVYIISDYYRTNNSNVNMA